MNKKLVKKNIHNRIKKHNNIIKLIVLLFFISYFIVLFIKNVFYYKNSTEINEFFPKVSFGIDIVGGEQLTVGVDTSGIINETLNNSIDFVSSYCKDNKINCDIKKEEVNNKENYKWKFSVKTINNGEKDKIKNLLKNIRSSLYMYDLHILENNDNKVVLNLMLSNQNAEKILKETTDKAISVLKNRIDGVGVKEISVERYGTDKIVILIPESSDVEKIKKIINTTAMLKFYLMHKYHIFYEKPKEIAKNHMLLQSYKNVEGEKYYLVQQKASLNGDCITSVQPNIDGITNSINFRMNANGAKKFAEITKNNIGMLLAIALDDKVIMAPMINVPISSGSGSITGNFTIDEVNELSVLLRSGSLPAKIEIINEKKLSSIFDSSFLFSAFIASLASLCVVAIIMSARYRFFGIIAMFSLFLNFIFTFGIITIFGFTLTLPGIAGFLLMLGMATDANILIFEKMKELYRQNVKQPDVIIKNGFSKAINTIMDANITTIIAGIALFSFGGSFIKGFSITLIIGIICSLFTSVNITKMIVKIIYGNRKVIVV